MPRSLTALLAAALGSLLLATPALAAGPGPAGKMQLKVGPVFGFGGEIEADVEGVGKGDNDLETTMGFQLEFQYPLHEFFTIGGVSAFRWVNTEAADRADIGRSAVIALNVAPRARYILLRGDLEIYLDLPLGIDITVPNDDFAGPGVSLSSGVGFSLGLFPGIEYFFTEMIGAYFELGFRTMNLSFEASAQGQTQDTTTSGVQFTMNLGVTFAFE